MSVDSSTLVFLDASCLIAASGSPNGGSAFLLSLCRRGFLHGAVSQPVLLEAERNIQTKLKPEATRAFQYALAMTPLLIALSPLPEEVRRYEGRVNAKDAHVIASAVALRAAFLLTLDRPLEQQVNAANLPIQALSPGSFITRILPTHADYPGMR